MNNMSMNAAVLWTGGKDSSLAFYEAELAGYKIKNLVTFIPRNPKFLAHPISFMKYQAEALGLPHQTIEINEPFKESYEKAILSLREKYGIDTLITGDIAEVNSQPNWIKECSKYSGIRVLTPLWGADRKELLSRLLSLKFKVIFSCVKKPWFTINWLGRELNEDSLELLEKMSKETNPDIYGEQGEYHTLVLDCPLFKKRIEIKEFSKCEKDELMHLDIKKVELREK